jgi:multiple sugar transport system substrate-binding protein
MRSWKKNITTLLALTLVFTLLAACGSNKSNNLGTDGNNGDSKTEKVKLSWAVWGNPGEMARYQEVTENFNNTHPNIEMELISLPAGEAEQKLLTQLSGGTAPDIFYTATESISKYISNGSIEELTPFLNDPESIIKNDDFIEGLWGASKVDEKVYGIVVDDNPMVLWYNKKVLQDAGVTELPGALYEKGEWNWDKFQSINEQVRASGKHGYILQNWWADYHSWVSTNAGQLYDETGKFIGNEDGKAKEAFKYLGDNFKSKAFTFDGLLPEGQGGDALFMSNQAAFVAAGRWYLPIFKQVEGLEFDIVPWPTNTGNKTEPAAVMTAYMVMNKDTEHKQEAWEFISAYTSKEGQAFRIENGGNSVPSIKGIDNIISAENSPESWKYFLEAREAGYGLTPLEASVPGLSTEMSAMFEELWLTDNDFDTKLTEIGEKVNKMIDENK